MNSNLLASLALCCAIVATCGGYSESEPPSFRVAGGHEVRPGKYPFMAQIRVLRGDDEWVHRCGGSVLDDQHVLTAAHCLMKKSQVIKRQELQVRLGCHQLPTCDSSGSTYNVSTLMVHHEYSGDQFSFSNDIAVLKLESKIKFNKIAGSGAVGKIKLAPRSDACCDSGTNTLRVVGWGHIDEFGTPNDVLHEARIKSIPLRKCESIFKGLVDQRMICAGDSAAAACDEDSGSPLLVDLGDGTLNQVGVTSSSTGTCKSKPGVYTKVAAFRKWVDDCLSGKGCKTR